MLLNNKMKMTTYLRQGKSYVLTKNFYSYFHKNNIVFFKKMEVRDGRVYFTFEDQYDRRLEMGKRSLLNSIKPCFPATIQWRNK